MTVNISRQMSIDAVRSLETGSPVAISRLERRLVRIVALEFLGIAGTCYITSAIYFEIFLSTWAPVEQISPCCSLYCASGTAHGIGL